MIDRIKYKNELLNEEILRFKGDGKKSFAATQYKGVNKNLNPLHRKWIIQLSIFGVIFVTILSAICYFAGTLLTAAAPAKIGPPPSDMHLENVEVRCTDKRSIRGWYGEGEKSRGAVILIHGIRSNRLQMLNRARFLQNLGITVFSFELKG